MSRMISFDGDSQPLKGAEAGCDFPIYSTCGSNAQTFGNMKLVPVE